MKKMIYQALFTAILAFAVATGASAQYMIVDQLGQPLLTKHYTDVKGSAYLYDSWMKGSVTTPKGVTFDNVDLMYDQVAEELIFKGDNGEAKSFIQPIAEFTLGDSKRLFRSGFIPVDGAKPISFYEVLADGNTQLLKRVGKKIFEELPYGSSTKVKTFQADTHYYLARDNKLTKIKNDRKAVLKALSDKESKLDEYIKSNRLDLKKDADFAKLMVYYNTL